MKDKWVSWLAGIARSVSIRAMESAIAVALIAILASSASRAADRKPTSSNLTVLYTFLGGADGARPNEVTLDPAGNLYGTTNIGGFDNCGPGCGVVFKIDARGHESLLRSFTGADGSTPYGGVFRDSSGVLYTATSLGGNYGVGTAVKLNPSPTFCAAALCPWDETVLYNFGSFWGDSAYVYADLIQAEDGNLYGTSSGGNGNDGTVFNLDSQGNETILYSFSGLPDGSDPVSSLVQDQAGNLYGTTSGGGLSICNCGTVFKLTPNGSSWSESIIYRFCSQPACADGESPSAGLVIDEQGNLYGTAAFGGDSNCFCGVVFELTPNGSGWTESNIYSFTGAPDGAAPNDKLLRDSLGNLYGTTTAGGTITGCPINNGLPQGCGTVFKLSPSGSGWTESILWRFSGGADGSAPYGPVVMDAYGNLYGAANSGGDLQNCYPIGCGVVFKITP